MKKLLYLGAVLGLFALAIGCQPAAEDSEGADSGSGTETKEVAALCGDCGHEKGTDDCCADDCEKCESCDLHKGSTLCCKELGDAAGKDLCTSCGHETDSDKCCAEGAEKCESCDLHKGSALCCKLENAEEGAE